MKKSNIKVHLIDEQSGRNSGIVHPQAGNDSVRRMMGSGDSGSGGSGSGDSGSGEDGMYEEGNTIHFYKVRNLNLNFSMGLITWCGTGSISVSGILGKKGINTRLSIQTSTINFVFIGTSNTYFDNDWQIEESGRTVGFAEPMFVTGNEMENIAKFESKRQIQFVKNVIKTHPNEPRQQYSEQENKTIKIKFAVVSSQSNGGSVEIIPYNENEGFSEVISFE